MKRSYRARLCAFSVDYGRVESKFKDLLTSKKAPYHLVMKPTIGMAMKVTIASRHERLNMQHRAPMSITPFRKKTFILVGTVEAIFSQSDVSRETISPENYPSLIAVGPKMPGKGDLGRQKLQNGSFSIIFLVFFSILCVEQVLPDLVTSKKAISCLTREQKRSERTCRLTLAAAQSKQPPRRPLTIELKKGQK